MKSNNLSNKKGFTLSEILITLGIIGVVAALTLPSFMLNVTQRINSERQANIAQKVTRAMEQMRAHGELNQSYPTTESFVDKLQSYLKVTKRCEGDKIAECWPTDKITMSDGEELEVSKVTKGKNLSLSTDTNNVGLILADGASIILNCNPAIDPIDVGDKVTAISKDLPVGNGSNKKFAYTSSLTNGIDFVMDVNGRKKPNSEVDGKARDIRSFKIAKFSKGELSCAERNGFEVDGVGCVVNVGTDYQPETDVSKSSFVATYCTSYPDWGCKDYWLGAHNKCASLNMHLTDWTEIRTLYERNCVSTNKSSTYNASTCISDIPQSGWFWSSAECDDTGLACFFKYFDYGNESIISRGLQNGALCVGN